MVEILVAMVISLIVIGAATLSFNKQNTVLADENVSTSIRAKGREAVDQLTEEIKMAGFGLPPNAGFTAISPTSLSYRTNQNDIRTTTPPCTACPGTVAAASGSTAITVIDETGFANGDKIVIYDPNLKIFETNTVTGTTAGTLNLGSALLNDYVYGINTNLVMVNKYNDVTITLTGTDITRTIDGSTIILVPDVVSATGLSLDYAGAATPAEVEKVVLEVSLVDPNHPNFVIDFKTDINMRNS